MAAIPSASRDQQEAFDKVQALLATKTLEELKKLELANKLEVTDKRLALRKLIGYETPFSNSFLISRYKDIIDSAAAINEMKSSVNLLRLDLISLQRVISQEESSIPSFSEQVGQAAGKKSQENDVFDLTKQSLPISQYQLLLVRRLRAVTEAPDVIHGFVKEKRWIEAASVYLRALKLLDQISTLSAMEHVILESGQVVRGQDVIQANSLLADLHQRLQNVKQEVTNGAQRFLARTRLHHSVAQEDNQNNSRDMVKLLQEWRQLLEKSPTEASSATNASFSSNTPSTSSKEDNMALSVMIAKLIETSAVRPALAGTAATMEHAAHSLAGALAALALLDDLTPTQLLIRFLRLRLESLRFSIDLTQYKSKRATTTSDFDVLQLSLSEWIRSTQWTIYLLFSIFLTQDKAADSATAASTSTAGAFSSPASTQRLSASAQRISKPVHPPSSLPLLHLALGAMFARQYGLQTSLPSKDCANVHENVRIPLSAAFIQNLATQWLSACVSMLPGASMFVNAASSSAESSISSSSRSILAPIKSGTELARLESFLVYQIEHPLQKYASSYENAQHAFAYPTSSPTWSGASTPNRSGSSTPRSGMSSSYWTSPSSHLSTPISAFGGISASALLAATQLPKWKTVSARVCGQPVDLWAAFFHNLFLHQAQHIIQESFLAVSIESHLKLLMSSCSSSSPLDLHSSASVSKDSALALPHGLNLFSADANILGEFVWSGGEGWNSAKVSEQLDRAHGITPIIHSLVRTFDDKLSVIMKDLRPLMVIEDDVLENDPNLHQFAQSAPIVRIDAFGAPEEGQTVVRRRFRGSTKEAMIPVLRTTIQENCVALVSRLAVDLQSRILSCTIPADSIDQYIGIQQAILLGRLAKSLDTHSTQLRAILWQLEWNAPTSASESSSPFGAISSSISKDAGPKWMDRLRRKSLASFPAATASLPPTIAEYSLTSSKTLRETYHLALSKWVDRLVVELKSFLASLLLPSRLLSLPARSGWTNVNIGTAAKGEMLVPGQPSAHVLIWLKELVAALYRVGAHNVDRFVLEYLVFSIFGAAASVFSNIISQFEVKNAMHRDIAVQLWFDLRFVFDILSKRQLSSKFFQDIVTSGSSAARSTSSMPAAPLDVEALVSSLKAKLDPVEAGFYAPHVANNVKLSISHHATLLSVLMSKKSDESGKSAGSGLVFAQVDPANSNLLSIVPNVPRFATLPVSTPTLAMLREMTSPTAATIGADAIATSQPSSTPSDADSRDASGVSGSKLISDKSRQALEAAGSIWGKISEGVVKTGWFS